MKKKITVIACTGLCALSLTGCQNKDVSEPKETEEIVNNEEIANPITMHMSGEELFAASGIDLANNEEVLNMLEKNPTDAVIWQTVGDDIAEIILEYDDGSSYDFRASKTSSGLQDLAGFYGEYPSEEVAEGTTLYEIDEDTVVLIYSKEGVNYAVTSTGPRDSEIQPRSGDDISIVEVDAHVMEIATGYAKEQGYIFSDGALEALQAYLNEYGEEGYSDTYIEDVIDMAIEKAVARVETDKEGTTQSDALIEEDFVVETTLY